MLQDNGPETLHADGLGFDFRRISLEAMSKRTPDVEEVLKEAFDCVSRVHGRELYARRQAAEAHRELARVRKSFSYRLGTLLVTHGRSPLGWLKLPAALWREFAKQRRIMASKSLGTAAVADGPKFTMRPDSNCTWIPLTRDTQTVHAQCGNSCQDLWVTALAARTGKKLELAMRVLRRPEQGPANEASLDQRERHRNLVIRRFVVESGAPFRVLQGVSGDVFLELFREQKAFFIVKIELRESGEASDVCSLDDIRPTGQSNGQSATGELREDAPQNDGLPYSASELEKKLWGGFARYAVPELQRLKEDSSAPISERESAAWSLIRWYYVEEDYDRALDNVDFVKRLSVAPQARFALAEAQCLVKLQRYERADLVLRTGAQQYDKPDFRILRSTVVRHLESAKGASPGQADQAQLDLLNELYKSAGLYPIQKRRNHEPLHISNITAVARAGETNQALKVSVIIPAYNAAGTLGWVLEGLLEQTWRNLEVIVVDDCSTDDTCQVVESIASRDPRVKLIRLETNGGAYAARNAGLGHASGELITVHDSDDWSHPQRIELQLTALESDDALVATKSHWIRVSEDLDVIGAWIPKGTVIDLNFSSLLFRRELLDVLGGWDDVLVSGDAEFYSRLKRIYGSRAVLKLPRHQLLAFSLARETSLTRTKATHLRSLYYGLRGNYRNSYRYWHSRLTGQSEELPFVAAAPRRRFPVPLANRASGKRRSSKYELVVISDFAMRGGAFVSTLNYVVAACKAGKKVAVFHWRRFDLSSDSPLQGRLYEACMDFDVDILVPGDDVEAEVALIGYPAILEHLIEPMPAIRAQHVLVVVNQFASRLTDGQDQQYDPLRVRKHLTSVFGVEGVWIPISGWVKRLMQEDGRYPTPYPQPWHPLIEVDSWCRAPIRWRGADRPMPTIGRHGRDAYTKWPSDPDALARAYGVGEACNVRFLGGADHAIGILGGRPANWSVMPFDDIRAEDFLQDLDFYVHYPHENCIEAFGRSVMEAMALGIPPVLPPQFKETFGNAVTYAAASEVPEVISALWRSQAAYLERAHAARSFVLDNCRLASFSDRLDALLGAAEVKRDEQGQPSVDPSTASGY